MYFYSIEKLKNDIITNNFKKIEYKKYYISLFVLELLALILPLAFYLLGSNQYIVQIVLYFIYFFFSFAIFYYFYLKNNKNNLIAEFCAVYFVINIRFFIFLNIFNVIFFLISLSINNEIFEFLLKEELCVQILVLFLFLKNIYIHSKEISLKKKIISFNG